MWSSTMNIKYSMLLLIMTILFAGCESKPESFKDVLQKDEKTINKEIRKSTNEIEKFQNRYDDFVRESHNQMQKDCQNLFQNIASRIKSVPLNIQWYKLGKEKIEKTSYRTSNINGLVATKIPQYFMVDAIGDKTDELYFIDVRDLSSFTQNKNLQNYIRICLE